MKAQNVRGLPHEGFVIYLDSRLAKPKPDHVNKLCVARLSCGDMVLCIPSVSQDEVGYDIELLCGTVERGRKVEAMSLVRWLGQSEVSCG